MRPYDGPGEFGTASLRRTFHYVFCVEKLLRGLLRASFPNLQASDLLRSRAGHSVGLAIRLIVLADGPAALEDGCAGDKAGVAELRAVGAHFETPLAFVLGQVARLRAFLRAVLPLVFLCTGHSLVGVGRL